VDFQFDRSIDQPSSASTVIHYLGMVLRSILGFCVIVQAVAAVAAAPKPHLIMMLTDDLGYNSPV
jgi:hypothetical protein